MSHEEGSIGDYVVYDFDTAGNYDSNYQYDGSLYSVVAI